MSRSARRTRDNLALATSNAVRHGLYSAAVAVAGETLEDWQAFQDSILASFEPQGNLEIELAFRAASLLWRLRRVPTAEANLTARDSACEALNAERRACIRADGKDPEFPDTCYASVLPAPDAGEPPPLPIPRSTTSNPSHATRRTSTGSCDTPSTSSKPSRAAARVTTSPSPASTSRASREHEK